VAPPPPGRASSRSASDDCLALPGRGALF
jgi:hypothetical protein